MKIVRIVTRILNICFVIIKYLRGNSSDSTVKWDNNRRIIEIKRVR